MATGIEPAPTHQLPPYKQLSNDELQRRIEAVRAACGKRLLILGHHYQQDEVILHSDLRGDSLKLSQLAVQSGLAVRHAPVEGPVAADGPADGPLPCLVEFLGYGGGRSLLHEWTRLPAMGAAHFVMDTRGQGSSWSPGATPDRGGEPTGGQIPGVMTQGFETFSLIWSTSMEN